MRKQKVSKPWLCIVAFILQCKGTITFAEDHSTEAAVQFLSETKAMAFPEIETNPIDSTKKKAAVELFNKQLNALRELIGDHDPSLIPLLIPYLHYTDEETTIFLTTPTRRDPKSYPFHWPAVATLMNIPGAAPALAKYVLDMKNPMGYRFHAFDVLTALYNGPVTPPGATTLEIGKMSNPALRAFLEKVANGMKPDGSMN